MPNRYRSDHLGSAILAELEQRGPMTTPWLAQVLGEKPRAIATSCITLARANRIRSYKTGNFYKSPSGKKTAESFWELGAADCPPLKPRRRLCPPEERPMPIGIDEADLEWMEKYRRQAKQRIRQRISSCPC
jgi:hypothetical protein